MNIRYRWAGVIGMVAGLAAMGCGEFGRPLEESAALKIAQDQKLSDAEALQKIAQKCASDPKLTAKVEKGWISASVKIDSKLHTELIDRDSKLERWPRDVQGYQRHLARQAICMIYAGRHRGLEGVRLGQVLPVNFDKDQLVIYDVSFERKAVEAVSEWDKARLDINRKPVFDAVFRTGKVHHDRTAEVEIKHYKF